jgi:hypothetical protein
MGANLADNFLDFQEFPGWEPLIQREPFSVDWRERLVELLDRTPEQGSPLLELGSIHVAVLPRASGATRCAKTRLLTSQVVSRIHFAAFHDAAVQRPQAIPKYWMAPDGPMGMGRPTASRGTCST